MKFFRIVFIAYVLIMCCQPVFAGEKLTIMSSEWPPFACSDKERPGFFIETVTEAFALSDIDVEYEFAPWARCMLHVEFGECFAVIPLAKTSKREKYGIFSQPVFMTRNPVVYNRKRNRGYDYTGMDSLKEYNLGGLLGWFYLPEWEKAGYKYHCLADQQTAFKMLDANRIDLTIFDEFAGKYLLSKHPEFKDSITFSKTSYADRKLYLMASRAMKGSERLIELFNANLQKLKANGFFTELAKKYDVPEKLFLP